MSTTAYENPLEALQAVLDVLEQQARLAASHLELFEAHGASLREHDRRLDELEESWSSLTLAVGELTRRARLVLNMKAATLTLTCLHCGNEYAREAGVQLCGPCWVNLGKPERYLRPAEPA